MKKIIFIFCMALFSVGAFAGGPSTKELASVDGIILAKVSGLEETVKAQEALFASQRDEIDSLRALLDVAVPAVKKPVESKEDLTYLLGALLGLLTYVVQNLLFKVRPIKDWVDEKFSKSGFAILLGLVASVAAAVVAHLNGGVEWPKFLLWLIGAWGTHFGTFVMQVKKIANTTV